MTREVKLHLYVRQEYEFLNSMIKEEILSIVSQPPELEITGNIASNWWLIQMPDDSDKNQIKQLLNNTPFRYDTMSFAFTINTGFYILLASLPTKLKVNTNRKFRYTILFS